MNAPENNELRAKEFLSCLGNGSGSPEQAYADDTEYDEEAEE